MPLSVQWLVCRLTGPCAGIKNFSVIRYVMDVFVMNENGLRVVGSALLLLSLSRSGGNYRKDYSSYHLDASCFAIAKPVCKNSSDFINILETTGETTTIIEWQQTRSQLASTLKQMSCHVILSIKKIDITNKGRKQQLVV